MHLVQSSKEFKREGGLHALPTRRINRLPSEVIGGKRAEQELVEMEVDYPEEEEKHLDALEEETPKTHCSEKHRKRAAYFTHEFSFDNSHVFVE